MSEQNLSQKIDCYCIMLRRASGAVTELYDKALLPVGINVKQYSTLSNLGELGCASTSELAERVELDRSTLVRNLKPLISGGLIRDEAAAGSRSHKFSLTDEGKKVVAEARPIWEETQERLCRAIGIRNIDSLMKNLIDLQNIK